MPWRHCNTGCGSDFTPIRGTVKTAAGSVYAVPRALTVVLRMPKELHAEVAEHAARQGVSINTWILTAIARSGGQ